MPCFINIGAYIGSNTMIDTWSTIGSCAHIGKNCHVSGGVGIGGVLEPITAKPGQQKFTTKGLCIRNQIAI